MRSPLSMLFVLVVVLVSAIAAQRWEDLFDRRWEGGPSRWRGGGWPWRRFGGDRWESGGQNAPWEERGMRSSWGIGDEGDERRQGGQLGDGDDEQRRQGGQEGGDRNQWPNRAGDGNRGDGQQGQRGPGNGNRGTGDVQVGVQGGQVENRFDNWQGGADGQQQQLPRRQGNQG